jgi:uncharacterized protein
MHVASPEQLTSLIIFAKAPLIGTVKTRMQPMLSKAQSLELHEALLQHTLNQVSAWCLPKVQRCVFFTPCAPDSLRKSIPRNIATDVQVGEDLGERLTHALSKKWYEGFRKVLFIGTDCPQLEQSDIEVAIRALDEQGAVIGPSSDGGYYLVGLSCLKPVLFSGIEWGTACVYEQTWERMKRHSVRCAVLRRHFDLDTYNDLLKFRRLVRETPVKPALRELLAVIDRFLDLSQEQTCR